MTIRERITIDPNPALSPKQSQTGFQHASTIALPFAGSVDVISTLYSPGACKRYLALDSTIVAWDLEYALGGGLGEFPAGAQLSFTLLVEDCANGDTTKVPYPVRAIQILSESPCGALYELGDIAYDENGNEVFNTFFVLIGVSPTGAVLPLSLQCDVGTGVVYFTNPTFFVLQMIDQCGSVVAAPGVNLKVEIVDGLQWGYLVDPVTGRPVTVIDNVSMSGGAVSIFYDAWGDEPPVVENVTLRVTSQDGQFKLRQMLFVTPQSDRVAVAPGRSRIQPGDTTRLDIQMLNYDGTVSTGELVNARYTILMNDTLAFLYSLDSTQTGTDISGVLPAAVLYIPPRPDLPDSFDVFIRVFAEEPCPTCMPSKANPGVRPMLLGSRQTRTILNGDSLFALVKLRRREEGGRKLRGQTSHTLLSGKIVPKPSGVADYGFTLPHHGGVHIKVVKKAEEACINVAFEHSPISPGDTVLLNFTTTDANGRQVGIPNDQPLDVFLMNYSNIGGYLYSQDGKQHTMVLDAALQPIWYVAADTVPADSVVAQIRAVKSERLDNFSMGILQGSVKRATLNNPSSARASRGGFRLTPALIRALADNKCPLDAGCIEEITLEFTATPNEVAKGEPMELRVKLTRGGKPVDLDAENPQIRFQVGDKEVNEADRLAELTYGQMKGSLLDSVLYSDARGGLVHFEADGSDYVNIFPLRIRITTTWVDEDLSSTLVIALRGATTIGQYFSQDAKPWGTEIYDSTDEHISKKGCALTCMAMAGTAKGIDIDPEKLNNWMNDNKPRLFTKRGGVYWGAIGTYGNISALMGPTFDGKDFTDKPDGSLSGTPLSNTEIDGYLSGNRIVFGLVKNIVENKANKTKEQHRHWLVLVKKLTNGYATLDPGYEDRVTLQAYSNNVYRLIIY